MSGQSDESAQVEVSGRVDITPGHCDLCLHALTFTCRSLGIPCERRNPPGASS